MTDEKTDDGMEKYAVEEDDSLQKTGTIERQMCPKCGASLKQHGAVSLCPSCGSEPFERKAAKTGE